MILFLEDWKKYPEAIVHLETKNDSFIRFAGLLKYMGVKNYAFCLALMDPTLKDIDPFSPDLTVKQITAIARECKRNPWYIFREIIRIPVDGSNVPISLQANRGNISMFWLFFNHITSLLIQPRQTGKSVSVDSLMTALLNMLCYRTYIHLFTKDDGLRSKNIARLKSIQDELPSYLNLKTRQDANNTEALSVKLLENHYVTSVPQASRKDALKVGRGYTTAIHQIDEICYINNIDVSLPALLTSSNAATDNAKASGAPYGFVFTTTAGHLTSDSGRYVKEEIYDVALRWTEHLFDCLNEEELRKTIKRNNASGKILVLLEFNHRQLGKTDKWLLDKMESAFAKGEDAEADFLNKWNIGTAESAIDKKYLDIINGNRVLDPYITLDDGYILRWYISKAEVDIGAKDRKLIMGLDTSEANGGDDICLNIKDVSSGETVATGNFNELNTIMFSEWVAGLLLKYPNLTLIIEKKSTGSTMIENLLLILPKHGIDPFKRIFNWVVDEYHVNNDFKKALETPLHHRDIQFYNKYKKYFGFATSGSGKQSRSSLYGKTLNNSLKYTANTVRDSLTIHQMSRLKKENGRIDHAPGEHDDSVIAYLLGYWFLTDAKNKHYYGIDNREVLSIVTTVELYLHGGAEAVNKTYRNAAIKKEINILEDEKKSASSEYERIMLSNKIKYLEESLEDEVDNKLNQDKLLEEAKSYLKYTITKPISNLYGLDSTLLAS